MKIKTFISILITTSLILLFQTPSLAGIYKWVDESGQVHYGERPGNAEAEQVTIRKNETTKPRAIKSDEDAEGKNTEQAAEEAVKPKEVEIPKKEKRRLCDQATSDITAINSRGRMREINEKGEYTYLSEKSRQQRLAAARKKQKKYCH